MNAKEAIDELWVQRGYGKWKASKWITLLHPDEIQAKLGYRLDREEAVGVLVAWSLGTSVGPHTSFLSPSQDSTTVGLCRALAMC